MGNVIEKTESLQMTPAEIDEEKKEHIAVVDYKMVTFSLAGKDYAIDIMKVKEIAKAGRFTFVPNTSPFVLGVYNLRGDIIPIIDLRLFFNIEIPERKNDQLENMLIVSVEEQTFGVVVDGIDKVVGIQSSTIQPPHPLFGDINIKYIYGVVESNNRLYILLDIDRIFGSRTAARTEQTSIKETVSEDISPVEKAPLSLDTVKTASFNAPPEFAESAKVQKTNAIKNTEQVAKQPVNGQSSPVYSQQKPVQADSVKIASAVNSVPLNNAAASQNLQQEKTGNVVELPKAQIDSVQSEKAASSKAASDDFSFVVDGLKTLKKFYVTQLNEEWARRRYSEWEKERGIGNTQLQNPKDADSFISTFFSPCSGTFWSKDYANAVYKTLPDNTAKQITVWNPGCGKGYEAFSLACLLKKRYPEARIRIYAHDIDLLCVSNAPLLTLPAAVAQDWYAPFVIKTVSGEYSFSSEIKETVLFEYHDCSNANAMPSVDIIFCRDMLSYLPEDSQENMFEDFEDKLKGNGMIILGENESLANRVLWSENMIGSIVIYGKQ